MFSSIPDDEPAIHISNLSFSHARGSTPSSIPALSNISLSLPRGSRTLLIGANGAGKSTLLQLLAGKRLLPKSSAVKVLGAEVFTRRGNNAGSITFLGTEWASSPVVRGDISVQHFLDSVGGYRYSFRRDHLLDLLDVDLDWHMHRISDGERRRVQLVMGLMAPWDVLLLDEVTVDLDILVRDELLEFLREESERRGATILYATHIFDGLDAFPTHIVHMRLGELIGQPLPWPLPPSSSPSTSPSPSHSPPSSTLSSPLSSSTPPTSNSSAIPPNPSPTLEANSPALLSTSHPRSTSTLHSVALHWLTQDRAHRRDLERTSGRKLRGARRRGPNDETGGEVPKDGESFFRKYDYSSQY